MERSDIDILRKHVADAAIEMFTSIDVALAVDERTPVEPSEQHEVAAFIGYTGETMRGTLTVVAAAEFLRSIHPLALNATDWELEVFDWFAELANQLLGRIKNKLHAWGIVLQVSTPKCVHAHRLHVRPPQEDGGCILRFRAGDARIGLWIDVSVEPGTILFTLPEPTRDCAAEGDVVLF